MHSGHIASKLFDNLEWMDMVPICLFFTYLIKQITMSHEIEFLNITIIWLATTLK